MSSGKPRYLPLSHPARVALREAGVTYEVIYKTGKVYTGQGCVNRGPAPYLQGETPWEVARKIAEHCGVTLGEGGRDA